MGGKKAGILTFILDAAKGAIPCAIIKWQSPSSLEWLALAALLAVVGHCYSPYLRGQGGKGVATAFGVIAIQVPPVALIALVIWLMIFVTTRISSIAALAALPAATIACYFFVGMDPRFFSILFISLIVIRKHEKNLIALLFGQERKF